MANELNGEQLRRLAGFVKDLDKLEEAWGVRFELGHISPVEGNWLASTYHDADGALGVYFSE